MPRGFFHKSDRLVAKAPTTLVPKCGACGLYKACKSPKMEPTGRGERRLLIVGEAPGREEDAKGRQFVGEAGQLLRETLSGVGIDPARDCRYTNAIICRPEGATPSANQIDHCRPNLIRTIDEFKPHIIVPLGTPAVQSLLAFVYREKDIGSISRWTGWAIPVQKINTWVCPTFDPSFVLRSDEKNPVPRMLFEQHLKHVATLRERPWDPVPNYKASIEVVLDVDKAAAILREFIKDGGPIALDYETTTLQPEFEGAAIVCASVCWRGKRTIAFPMFGAAFFAMRDLLRSPCPKIGANIKFEEKWSRSILGCRVKNWAWDAMNNAHIIDNRPNISSVKFQAFAMLGAESYDEHIKPLLKAVKGKKINQVAKEIDLSKLLLYCGLDSLLEYKIAKRQMALLGMKIHDLIR